jgi:hypothetical protein
MTRVAIAQNDDIAQAIDEALGHLDLEDLIAGKTVAVKPDETATPDGDTMRYLWEAGRIGLGVTDPEGLEFPGMSLDDAVKAFTERAYGEALTF